MRYLLTTLALLLSCLSAQAESATAPPSILEAMTGEWEGQLYYLDYQSGQRFGIPLAVRARLSPDGVTLTREMTYTDPGVLVHAVSLSTFDRDSGEWLEAYFREGRGEVSRQAVTQKEQTVDGWTLTTSTTGQDDNRTATIEQRWVVTANRIVSEKWVRYEGEEAFILRNSTELDRTAD